MTFFIDLDGTLIETGKYHAEMHNLIAQRLVDDGYLNVPADYKSWRTLVESKTIEDKDYLERLESKIRRPFYANKIEACEGAEELLQAVHRVGGKVIVLTGSPTEHAVIALKRLNLDRYVSGYISSPIKHTTKCYTDLLESMKLKPEETVFIDNDPLYVKSAEPSGMKVYPINNKYHDLSFDIPTYEHLDDITTDILKSYGN